MKKWILTAIAAILIFSFGRCTARKDYEAMANMPSTGTIATETPAANNSPAITPQTPLVNGQKRVPETLVQRNLEKEVLEQAKYIEYEHSVNEELHEDVVHIRATYENDFAKAIEQVTHVYQYDISRDLWTIVSQKQESFVSQLKDFSNKRLAGLSYFCYAMDGVCNIIVENVNTNTKEIEFTYELQGFGNAGTVRGRTKAKVKIVSRLQRSIIQFEVDRSPVTVILYDNT